MQRSQTKMWISNNTHSTNASEEHNVISTTKRGTHSETEYEILFVINRIILGLCWCGAVLSLAAFIIGFVSWIILPKWRHFRNYVLQNIIFCCLIYTTCPLHVYFNTDPKISSVIGIIFSFFVNVFIHWLVVATIMFYMDLVKVFNNNFKYKFWMSTIFAWLIPVIVTLLFVYVHFPPAYLTTDETILNFLLYIRVLISLSYPTPGRANKRQTCRIVLFSTLAFFITGFLLYFPVLIAKFHPVMLVWSMKFVSAIFMLTAILISISFVLMKSNRILWTVYWARAKVPCNANFHHFFHLNEKTIDIFKLLLIITIYCVVLKQNFPKHVLNIG